MNDERPLIDSYLDGELIPDEESRLAEWLAADRAHVRQFVRETHLHRHLREAMVGRQFQDDTLVALERAESRPWAPRVRSLADHLAHLFALASTVRRMWLPLAVCLALMTGVALWYFGPIMGEPVLAEVEGIGFSLERAGQPITPLAGTHLQSGDVLRTSNKVTASISFAPEATRLMLQPDSELKLGTIWRGKRLVLRAGKLAASVARQRLFRPMMVTTPLAEATVVGTEFTLAATTNTTRLDVLEGIVRFKRLSDGKTVPVVAGSFAIGAVGTSVGAQSITGKVLREFWLELPGDSLWDLTYHARYPSAPSGHDFPANFETNTNWPSAFGTRMRGYLLPPVKGDYEFQVAGNGQMVLWLSPSEDPADRVKIGQIIFTRNRPGDAKPVATRSRQESGLIPLEAGRRYYIEIQHKYGNGEELLTVTWKRPNGNEEPIPAEYLAPFPLGKRAKP